MKPNATASVFALSALIAVASAACVQISEPGPTDSTANHSTNFPTSEADAINGTVAMTVATKVLDTVGNYSPKNVVALWVEDETGLFVRTLGVRAATRKKYLENWIDSQGSNTVDGLTGATRSGHTENLVVSWDGTNIDDTKMKKGNYLLRGEITDHNGAGATFSVPIDVSGAASTAPPYTGNGFASVNATYTP